MEQQQRCRRRRSPEAGRSGDLGRSGQRSDEASEDEASADEARQRLRQQGIVPIEPDERIRVLLGPGESVIAVRHSVVLERRWDLPAAGGGLDGDLYVTSRRLVHLGRVRVEYALAEIRDAMEADGALRLIVGEDRGVDIKVRDPRLLRVEIAAVREAARASAGYPPRTLDGRNERASSDQGSGDGA